MNQEEPETEERTFGEKLLGMQGFNAVRARRYREELETLLVHRISRIERWNAGVGAIVIGVALVLGGVSMASAKEHPEYQGFDQARLIIAATCVITGLVMGGWLMRITIQGGYGRRLGDFMGVLTALLFCGGWGFAFMNLAWETTDARLRIQSLLVGGFLLVVMSVCFMIALIQRMHRQTQEKLLRIEYHLAELMERIPESRSS